MTDQVLAMKIADTGDRNAMVVLLVATERHYWGEREGAAAAAAETAEAILSGTSGCRMLLALDGAAPLGYATFTILHPAPNAHGALFLKDLFASEAARGKNVGARLMQHLAKIAVERGCARFDWTAETDNPRALAFYDRLEARRVSEKVYFRFDGEALLHFAEGNEHGRH